MAEKIQSAKDLIKEKITKINLDWNKQSDLKLNIHDVLKIFKDICSLPLKPMGKMLNWLVPNTI